MKKFSFQSIKKESERFPILFAIYPLEIDSNKNSMEHKPNALCIPTYATAYVRNIRRRRRLPDELKEKDVVAHRQGKQFCVEEIGSYSVAKISLKGEIVLYNFHNTNELVKQVQRLATIIKNYSRK